MIGEAIQLDSLAHLVAQHAIRDVVVGRVKGGHAVEAFRAPGRAYGAPGAGAQPARAPADLDQFKSRGQVCRQGRDHQFQRGAVTTRPGPGRLCPGLRPGSAPRC